LILLLEESSLIFLYDIILIRNEYQHYQLQQKLSDLKQVEYYKHHIQDEKQKHQEHFFKRREETIKQKKKEQKAMKKKVEKSIKEVKRIIQLDQERRFVSPHKGTGDINGSLIDGETGGGGSIFSLDESSSSIVDIPDDMTYRLKSATR
jgi:ATPase subunit of ABC transporter with duplicated ATPase domains